MKNVVMSELVMPLFRRAGTVLGTYLIAKGADAEMANQVVFGVAALGAFCVDLLWSHIDRKIRK
ncbi:hypothetical protein [uncultured Tateyamaria sp.]|uniref:hypothetical protein n=1 Tax=uncultured Tateyamaria sp. TaxID=455651 RepID=UPI00260B6B59|nr:hypothetical protein [uncultured Tateyamaria sp.]